MISLVGSVRYEHFKSLPPATELNELALLVTNTLSSAGATNPQVTIGKTGFNKGSGVYRSVPWIFGEDASAINFSIGQSKDADAAHWLRIEFNPRKLGPKGIFDLVDAIHDATGQRFLVGKFLSTCRVSRLDIAVDVVGLLVPELIVTAKGEAKRVHYYGSDGCLESLYLHKKTSTAKTSQAKPSSRKLGTQIARIYDRRREMIFSGKQPDFGPVPMTRIEVMKKHFGNKPFELLSLLHLKNPLKDIFVGLATSAAPENQWAWLEYVELRRGGGHDWACRLMSLSKKDEQAYADAYRKHPRDVLLTDAIWAHWKQGVQSTGLDFMMQAASAGSAGSSFALEGEGST
ncbi:hypothetical protein [Brevundimonas sp.]|uniref:hypothetical protein n=1 Tax=Brevundimonas sp. TaxID=1871086 RepID=UPI0026151B05|nr:hypothetical protein [Brevundimonas sp.]